MRTVYFDKAVISATVNDMDKAIGLARRRTLVEAKTAGGSDERIRALNDFFNEASGALAVMRLNEVSPADFFAELACEQGVKSTAEQARLGAGLFDVIETDIKAESAVGIIRARRDYLGQISLLFKAWHTMREEVGASQDELLAHKKIAGAVIAMIAQVEEERQSALCITMEEGRDYTLIQTTQPQDPR